jgi:hypothetical protein
MTKEQIIKLYIADLNNLVADSDAKRNRIMDLEDELEALKQGQSLPIDSVSKRSFAVSYMGKDEHGDIIKSIEVVEENESKAIEKVLEVNRSRDIYGAVEVDAC